jgi:site-specific recombinase XerD
MTVTVDESLASLTISVFTRHSEDCSKRHDPQWRRCKCRKSLYIREHGKTRYMSAKTRSWEEAERVARAARDKRDPVKIELQKLAERKKATLKPLNDALEQWITGMKAPVETSIEAYRSTTRRIQRWADRMGIVYVSDVTPAMLDAWRGSWSPDASDEENRLALTTQAALLTRVKSFFRWAAAMEYVRHNPTLTLKAITPDESQTWPLTPEQFKELLAATHKLDKAARYRSAKVGQHLRAIFLVQRWTGLRIGDVVVLPKSALVGNRLTAEIRKKRKRKPTASRIECVLPDHVIEALTSLPLRKEEHPDYFFWSRQCSELVNTNKWVRKVDTLNEYLSFKDEAGRPMDFRSHMLRDTFAVEMLLAHVPLEKVSKLLTHESVAITERYYAKWTRSRKQQLEDEAIAAMRKMGASFENAGHGLSEDSRTPPLS